MTKKEFKDRCSFHQYGRGQSKKNAIFFDWESGEKDGKYFAGFRYMVKTSIQNCTKAQLFEMFWEWVMHQEPLPFYVIQRYAEFDTDRFKVPIVG